ncbi:premnaspirodiene oxygenase-like isoform X3 [Quercus robur]|uniref:premnaspirodiene oxygenase-like isoform X3 n=1 Tax=Quercus robur TaxID=38942 RepID=UPI0021615DC9|nr:premnaspirodiene oxygenase-like isoform X3 [Quercus robur]
MLQVPPFPLFTWLFFLFILVIYWKRSKAKGQSHKLPPGPWKLPLIGNLHQLFFSLPHRSLRDLAKKYGPIMQLQLGEVLAIIISSPKVVEEVLKTHDTALANRPSVLAIEAMSYGNSEGVPINLSEKIFSSTYCIASRAAIGKKCKYEKEFISLIQETFTLSGGFDLPDLFPSLKFLGFLTGMKSALEKIQQNLDKILDDIVNEHKMKRIATSTNKHEPGPGDEDGDDDLVDVLLKLQEMGELEFSITSNHIKAVTQDIFTGASETSASTIEWAMSELLRNPRVMEKAQAEVRQVLQGRRNLDETYIHKLDYLKLVVKETLRLHPPGALVPRESREKCEINGYEIPSNTKVIINIWAIGRDPEYWIDADCFWPERFHGSSIDLKGTNFEFIPFGGGRRICPGMSFALAIVELVLSQLLFHFNWKLPNDTKLEELDISESLGLTCRRRNDLYVIATPWASLFN